MREPTPDDPMPGQPDEPMPGNPDEVPPPEPEQPEVFPPTEPEPDEVGPTQLSASSFGPCSDKDDPPELRSRGLLW